MKRLLLVVFSCFYITALFAQSPKVLEDDLLKAFKKIDHSAEDNSIANDAFARKLKTYTEKYPATITQDFASLKNQGLTISTAKDGVFRIYSWDTQGGGTMHFFESVIQYKLGARTISVLDTPKSDGDNRPNYNKIYSFVNNGHSYYLATFLEIGSTKDIGRGVDIFQIENGKLVNANIIKTGSGMHSQLSFGYDLTKGGDEKINSDVYFDEKNMLISLPLVAANGKLTAKTIIYKFNGQYFERIKN
jgi:hypothetical protein